MKPGAWRCLAFVTALAACAGGLHAQAALLPIVPMRLMANGAGAGELPLLALAPDGSLTLGGQPGGRLEGTRVLNVHGDEILRVEANGRIVAGTLQPGVLDANGDVESPRGTVHVADDGVPVIIHRATGRRDPGPLRVAGFTPAGRSTATVLVILVLLLNRSPAPTP